MYTVQSIFHLSSGDIKKVIIWYTTKIDFTVLSEFTQLISLLKLCLNLFFAFQRIIDLIFFTVHFVPVYLSRFSLSILSFLSILSLSFCPFCPFCPCLFVHFVLFVPIFLVFLSILSFFVPFVPLVPFVFVSFRFFCQGIKWTVLPPQQWFMSNI